MWFLYQVPNAKIWSTVEEFAFYNNCIHYVLGFFERDQEVQNLAAVQSLYVTLVSNNNYFDLLQRSCSRILDIHFQTQEALIAIWNCNELSYFGVQNVSSSFPPLPKSQGLEGQTCCPNCHGYCGVDLGDVPVKPGSKTWACTCRGEYLNNFPRWSEERLIFRSQEFNSRTWDWRLEIG